MRGHRPRSNLLLIIIIIIIITVINRVVDRCEDDLHLGRTTTSRGGAGSRSRSLCRPSAVSLGAAGGLELTRCRAHAVAPRLFFQRRRLRRRRTNLANTDDSAAAAVCSLALSRISLHRERASVGRTTVRGARGCRAGRGAHGWRRRTAGGAASHQPALRRAARLPRSRLSVCAGDDRPPPSPSAAAAAAVVFVVVSAAASVSHSSHAASLDGFDADRW